MINNECETYRIREINGEPDFIEVMKKKYKGFIVDEKYKTPRHDLHNSHSPTLVELVQNIDSTMVVIKNSGSLIIYGDIEKREAIKSRIEKETGHEIKHLD